jgi:D-aminopeptidase
LKPPLALRWRRRNAGAPRRKASYKVELQLRDTLIPEVAGILPGMQRPAPDTLAFQAETMPRAYALIRLLYRYINPE